VIGTAFRVSADRYVTHFHVIQGCQRLRVNGTQNAQAQASDERNDLALLSTPASSGATAIIRIGRIQLGEQVVAAGFPARGDLSRPSVASGTVSSLSGPKGDTRYLQISARNPLDNSGPVFDASGNVLGLSEDKVNVIGSAQVPGDIQQNVSFAITPSMLQGFLDAHSVEFETAGLGIASLAQVEAKAHDIVALVECWR
jgi:serine protease Do